MTPTREEPILTTDSEVSNNQVHFATDLEHGVQICTVYTLQIRTVAAAWQAILATILKAEPQREVWATQPWPVLLVTACFC